MRGKNFAANKEEEEEEGNAIKMSLMAPTLLLGFRLSATQSFVMFAWAANRNLAASLSLVEPCERGKRALFWQSSIRRAQEEKKKKKLVEPKAPLLVELRTSSHTLCRAVTLGGATKQ